MPEHHADDEQAAHGGRALLDVVGLRPLDADALAHAQAAQQADEGRHQDDDDGEGEQDALDDRFAVHAVGSGGACRQHELVDEQVERGAARGLDEDGVAVLQQRQQGGQGLGPVGDPLDAVAEPGRPPGRPRRCRPRRRRRRRGGRPRRPPRRPRDGARPGLRRPARASRRARRCAVPAALRGGPGLPGRRRERRCRNRRGWSRCRRARAASGAGRRPGGRGRATISSADRPAHWATAAAARALWTPWRPRVGVDDLVPPWAGAGWKRMPAAPSERTSSARTSAVASKP